MGLSDLRHWQRTEHDLDDAIKDLERRRSVVADGPGQAVVRGCCEGSDARVTVALLRAAPSRPASSRAWPLAGDVDLDHGTGALTFVSTGGTEAVVTVPKGRYRMRFLSAGAQELQQERDAYRVELWPRAADAPLRVLRPAPTA